MSVTYREGHQELSFRMDFTDIDFSDVSEGKFKLKRPDGTIDTFTGNVVDNAGKARLEYSLISADLPLSLGAYILVGELKFSVDNLIGYSQESIKFDVKDLFYS